MGQKLFLRNKNIPEEIPIVMGVTIVIFAVNKKTINLIIKYEAVNVSGIY